MDTTDWGDIFVISSEDVIVSAEDDVVVDVDVDVDVKNDNKFVLLSSAVVCAKVIQL